MKENEPEAILETYPILPLRNTILFPNQIIPIYIGRKQSLDLIEDISKLEKKYVVVVAQKDGAIENPTDKDIYKYIDIEKCSCHNWSKFGSKSGFDIANFLASSVAFI